MKAIFSNCFSPFVSKVGVLAVMFLIFSSLSANAQSSLRGVVTDANGEPLAGVAVLVVGTNNGAVTDLDGNYALENVKGGAEIEFSCIGLSTQKLAYDGKRAVLNVTMEEDAEFLDEVIVVGYGTAKKSSMTSAVSAMKGDELLKAPSTNVSQLLGGKLPGISSVQESGEPGLDQASLKIRGSYYNVAYIVDGFPVQNINDIDPADIESVSVLKDGASAAVYGLSGAGGVIIVTTKRGDSGKPKITYSASVGASMNANFPEFMDGPEFAYYYNMAQMMDQIASGAINDRLEYVPHYTQANIEAMLNNDPTDGWDNVDYINKVFGTGVTQKHNVTVQGGSEKTRYFTSFGYLGQDGNIDNFDYNRYNVRANIDSDIARNIKFTLGLSGVLSDRHTPGYASGGTDSNSYLGEQGFLSISRQTIQMHPYLPEKYNGKYTAAQQRNNQNPNSPLAAIYESGYRNTRAASISVNTSLSWDIPWVKGLQAKVSGSFDYSSSHNKNVNTPYSVMVMNNTGGVWAWSEKADPRNPSGVELGEGANFSQTMTGQASLSYIRSFGKHNVEALALAEMRDYKTNNLLAYAWELPFASLPELNFGKPQDGPIAGTSGASRSAGYVFRAKYNYDERYLAEFTGRYDGSYKFAGMQSTRWGFFPSVSLGWNMAKESWLENFEPLNELKLRGSVGLLGYDSVSEYMFLSQYSGWTAGGESIINVPYFNGTSTVLRPTYVSNGVANSDLSWEKILSYNVGFDLNMWDDKLGAEVDFFYSHTYDMLSAVGGDYPPSMGGNYPTYANMNALDTRGVDILLSHRNTVMAGNKPFTYTISGSVTYSKSRWLVYPDSPNTVEWRKVVGTTVGSIQCWLADGLYRSEAEIDNSPWYGTRPNVGDIRYVDINGDGKIDWDDRGYFGRSNRPELTYGLNIGLNWNGIDFNAQFTGGSLFDVSLTGNYYNGYDDNTIWTQTFKEGANSPLFLVENAYSIDNPTGTFPRITLGATGHGGDNGLSSTFWLRDGTYVRLKSAQLGYTFPRKWMDKIRVQSLRIFVEGQNIFTIDGLPEGIDPESPGVNNGYYPQQRLLMGGLQITF